ncbi:MAG: bifunctional 4-hydroxy-2-oxoglutarate aldolase/2-dehydro-3-deoxy-phosphogluconate aldolase [Lachnospiraceae bacterium]
MKQEVLFEQIKKHKIVPVVKIDRVDDTKPLCKALSDGGLPVAEITFRTAAAEESIRIATAAFPEMLIGAGTIVNVEQARRAVAAGAAFLVSPGFSKPVVEFALANLIPIFPGACTPSELMQLLAYDLRVAKFFPAGQFGGLATIKALAAPFPDMLFMPTGGISASNIRDFLAFDKIIACGGSWMVKDSLVQEGDFVRIRQLTQEAVALAQ